MKTHRKFKIMIKKKKKKQTWAEYCSNIDYLLSDSSTQPYIGSEHLSVKNSAREEKNDVTS